MAQQTADKARVIETTVEIAAPVSAVWKALTDARELERWFPLEARVTPGVGGEVFMSWGAPWEGGSRIDVWEENKRLRTRGFLEHGDASLVEYTLEARGGKTVLRLVHSGFAHGTDWEDELFGGTERGWRYELRSLRHYLERHAGTDRRALWPRAKVRGTAAEVWNRLVGKERPHARGAHRGPEGRRPLSRDGRHRGRVRGPRRRERPALRVLGHDRGPERLADVPAHPRRGRADARQRPRGLPVALDLGRARSDVEALGERWRRLLDTLATSEG